jgi:hypothetical protein
VLWRCWVVWVPSSCRHNRREFKGSYSKRREEERKTKKKERNEEKKEKFLNLGFREAAEFIL